jgi:hypothetical protein
MLDDKRIESIAHKVASANLSSSLSNVLTTSIIDSEGQDALRIMIILRSGCSDALTGNVILNTIAEIHNKLQKAGEERFPFVRYKDELEESGATRP